ncbi:MAG TPA: zinc ribbon domain-containing protein [Gemmatimonadaceae bacterium]|nr:zinc ribbon domain-containing protein [Gemmatimonadaceae bacterium]
MPTYEYRCPQGHEFEKFYRKISDAQAELPCPECGRIAARQLSAGAGLLFKGSGFYLTDYGKNAHRKAAPAGESTAKSNGKQGEAKPADAGTSAGGAAESKPVAEKPAAAKPPASKPSSGSGKSDS